MIIEIIIGSIVSVSFLIGYFLRIITKKEVDNFFKDYNYFLILKKGLKIRVVIYGFLLGISLIYYKQLSLIFFALGLIEGSVFTNKDLKKNIHLSIILFIIFLAVYSFILII